MESLGFSDAPSETTVVYNAPSQLSTTTTVITRPTAPTGHLVQDLWDSTELDAPSLVDWKPISPDRRHLKARRFRWSTVLLLLIVAVAAGGTAFWLYQRSSGAAAASVAAVQEQATQLSASLDGIGPIADQLAAPASTVNLTATDLFDLDDAARGLFDASVALPDPETDTETIAGDAASLSFEIVRQLRDGLAYRGALEPMLVAPALETDPTLTDMATATFEFSKWRSEFDNVRAALPEGVAATVTFAVDEFSAGLEAAQGTYLDAIRNDDRAGAEEALQALESDLDSIRGLMLTTMGGLAGQVGSELEETRR
ncbi:MAG TPA: hypothetical protein VI193_03655, partial [Acidimicrobiia bacterium]